MYIVGWGPSKAKVTSPRVALASVVCGPPPYCMPTHPLRWHSSADNRACIACLLSLASSARHLNPIETATFAAVNQSSRISQLLNQRSTVFYRLFEHPTSQKAIAVVDSSCPKHETE